jgi:hypothetical protein
MWDTEQPCRNILSLGDKGICYFYGSVTAPVVYPDNFALRPPTRSEGDYLVGRFGEAILLIEKRNDKADAGLQQDGFSIPIQLTTKERIAER